MIPKAQIERVVRFATPLCQGDFRIQKYLPKGIVFKHTQVIAEGDSYCDFRYYAYEKIGR